MRKCLCDKDSGLLGHTHRWLHQQLPHDRKHAGEADRGAHCGRGRDKAYSGSGEPGGHSQRRTVSVRKHLLQEFPLWRSG